MVERICLVIGLAQFLLGSNHMEFEKDKNPFKLSLIPSSFGHDNSYFFVLIVEMHKKLQTVRIEFGLNSKAC